LPSIVGKEYEKVNVLAVKGSNTREAVARAVISYGHSRWAVIRNIESVRPCVWPDPDNPSEQAAGRRTHYACPIGGELAGTRSIAGERDLK
jgi:hypothetical protein